MNLLPELTQLEKDQKFQDSLVLMVAEATHNLASVMESSNLQFWSLPTERLLELLNFDVQRTLLIFQENTAQGITVNSSLDKLNLSCFPSRAPLATGRNDIIFDGFKFILVEDPTLNPN